MTEDSAKAQAAITYDPHERAVMTRPKLSYATVVVATSVLLPALLVTATGCALLATLLLLSSAPLAAQSLDLGAAGTGSISEVFDAEPPFTPRGCIAQAWSVAEVLRLAVRGCNLVPAPPPNMTAKV